MNRVLLCMCVVLAGLLAYTWIPGVSGTKTAINPPSETKPVAAVADVTAARAQESE